MAKKVPHAATLLVELLTEELPPKALKSLSEAFRDRIVTELAKRQLHLRDFTGVRVFATPRRLAVLIPDTKTVAEERETTVSGPPVSAGNQAIEGFARKQKVSVDSLERQPGPKGEVVVARVKIPGQVLEHVLAHAVEEA